MKPYQKIIVVVALILAGLELPDRVFPPKEKKEVVELCKEHHCPKEFCAYSHR